MDFETFFSRVEEAALWLRKRAAMAPRAIVVLSAGLEGFARDMESSVRIPFAEILHFPQLKAEGHSGELIFGSMKGVPVAVLAGRFHYYEGHSLLEVIFPYFVLSAMGAGIVVVTNAVGGINKSFKPGDLMLVTDHINMMGVNPLVGIAFHRTSNQFTDMTNAYDAGLRELSLLVAKRLGMKLREGVYMAVSGPSYETKAEIRAFRALGADAVGMSTVPEVIAANFLGLKVLCFSCIANAAADLHEGAISHSEVLEAMQKLSPRAVALIEAVVEEIGRSQDEG
ncbi:MAG: purine-nucleoside phosphorylase [bacterium]